MYQIFLDTEFSDLRQNAHLLSLALVPQDGPWFYAVFTDVPTSTISNWTRENVVPFLDLSAEQQAAAGPGTYLSGNHAAVTAALRNYLALLPPLVVWADVPAYDWVLFCELFGGSGKLPENVPYIVRDLATLLEVHGLSADLDRFNYVRQSPILPQLPATLPRYNALADALNGRILLTHLSNNPIPSNLVKH